MADVTGLNISSLIVAVIGAVIVIFVAQRVGARGGTGGSV